MQRFLIVHPKAYAHFSRFLSGYFKTAFETITIDDSIEFQDLRKICEDDVIIWIEHLTPRIRMILSMIYGKPIILHIYNEDLINVNEGYLWEELAAVLFESEKLKEIFSKKYPNIYRRIYRTGILRPFIYEDRYNFIRRQSSVKNPSNASNIVWYPASGGYTSLSLFKEVVNTIQGDWKFLILKNALSPEIKVYLDHLLNSKRRIDYIDRYEENVVRNSIWLYTDILGTNVFEILKLASEGIKVMVHNFVGATEMFKRDFTFLTIDEAIHKINNLNHISENPIKFENFLDFRRMMRFIRDILDEYNETFKNSKLFFIRLREMVSDRSTDIWTKRILFNRWIWKFRDKAASYRFFTDIPEDIINSFIDHGKVLLKKYGCNSSKKYSDVVLFVVPSVDFIQASVRLIINIVLTAQRLGLKGYQILLLDHLENNSYPQEAMETVKCLNKMGVRVWYTDTRNNEEREKYITTLLCSLRPQYLIIYTFIFPIYSIFTEIFRESSRYLGRFVMQDLEKNFDKKYLDFMIYPFEIPFPIKNQFKNIPPVETWIIDDPDDIREKFGLQRESIVGISVGRPIKYKDDDFWEFVFKIVEEHEDLSLVFFGPSLKDEYFKNIIPKKLINQKKIILAGYRMSARRFLKSADFYLNSYPIGGGIALYEAYYAGIPIVSFIQSKKGTVSIDDIAYRVPEILYKGARDFFPEIGDFKGLEEMIGRLIAGDKILKTFYKENEKLNRYRLTYGYYVKEFEAFLRSLK